MKGWHAILSANGLLPAAQASAGHRAVAHMQRSRICDFHHCQMVTIHSSFRLKLPEESRLTSLG
jgi:hypothetical protein